MDKKELRKIKTKIKRYESDHQFVSMKQVFVDHFETMKELLFEAVPDKKIKTPSDWGCIRGDEDE